MLPKLLEVPNLQLFLILSCGLILFSILCVILVNRFIPLSLRYQDNPVLGNVSGLISIIYGVLVGLTALYLINNINDTADSILSEANATADIYRDSKWLKAPASENIHQFVREYLNYVVNTEWPLMKEDAKVDNKGSFIINKIANELVHYPQPTPSESMLLHDMFDSIKQLYDAREQRIHLSSSALNAQMWMVILIGTLLTLFITYIFGINFYLHLVTVSAVALMSASMIFLLITLDRPLQGEFVIEPHAMKAVLSMIDEMQTEDHAHANNERKI